MVKNKNNMAIWGSRIKKDGSTLFQKIGNSIDVDKKLFREDILGSIAHVEMLFRQKIISFKIKNKIIYGLNKIVVGTPLKENFLARVIGASKYISRF